MLILLKSKNSSNSSQIISYQFFFEKSRIFQCWRTKISNFVCGLNDIDKVVSFPRAICDRSLMWWENQVFVVKNDIFWCYFFSLWKSLNETWAFQLKKTPIFAPKTWFSHRISDLSQIALGNETTLLMSFNPQTKFDIFVLEHWKIRLFSKKIW